MTIKDLQTLNIISSGIHLLTSDKDGEREYIEIDYYADLQNIPEQYTSREIVQILPYDIGEGPAIAIEIGDDKK